MEAFENEENYQFLADQLYINRNTARSIGRVWQVDSRIDRLPQSGRLNIKVNQEVVDAILLIAREKPFSTCQHKFHIPTATVARHLEAQLISVKIAGKNQMCHFNATHPKKEQRFKYATWFANVRLT